MRRHEDNRGSIVRTALARLPLVDQLPYPVSAMACSDIRTTAMKTTAKSGTAKRLPVAASAPAVEAVFNAYPKPVKARLLALRRLIFDTAKTTKGVGALEETLK
ncbi:hypothetical protein [Bradyrhizobium sp. AUGA SZCCT0042]|uniref:hypothetical protein n=1 Tax=Bradyrhizobium sp. AUGA SZCCT0042 TaxID=2807651 RepID=UPI002012E8DB|nr:hypothetical protein [Bradyrhizobium sp. AUGA SZCCT0042]